MGHFFGEETEDFRSKSLELAKVDAFFRPLMIILIGSLFVLPFIGAYTVFSYYTFRGKTENLRYY
jgi:cytochrome bd-type quinol oxidase subunit 2